MSRYCQVTGARPGFGKSVSHSHKRTNRRWDVNVQRKKYYVPSLGRNISINVSARGIKVIDKIGIDAAVAKMKQRGEKF